MKPEGVDQMSIGPALQKVRQNRHLTQAEVASQLYVTRQTISRWGQGKTTPNIYALKDLAELYGVSIDELTNTSLLNPVQEEGDPMKQVNWMALFGIFWFNVLFTAGAVVAVIGLLVGLWVTITTFISAPLLLFIEWLLVAAYHLSWPASLTWYDVPLSLIFCGLGISIWPMAKNATVYLANFFKKYVRYNLKAIYR